MNDIRWQDPYKRRFSEQKRYKRKRGSVEPQKRSFADQFLRYPGDNQSDLQHPNYTTEDPYTSYHRSPQPNGQQKQENYYSFQQATGGIQGYRNYPPHVRQQPVYGQPQPDYAAPPPPLPSGNGQTQWRFLDLQNRKQTGDLYKRILSAGRKGTAKTFCFTASTANEGVSTVLINLLSYIKNQGNAKRIVIIDANMAHPDMSRALNLPTNGYGLRDVLGRRVPLHSALMAVGHNIWALGCGTAQQYDKGNFEPEEFSEIIKECHSFADMVFIDCPPVLSSSDALSVAPSADVSFLIVQAVKMRRQVAEKALVVLQNNECELGGVILNRIQQVIPSWIYRYI